MDNSSLYGISVDELEGIVLSKNARRIDKLGGIVGLEKALRCDTKDGLDPFAKGSQSIDAHRHHFEPNIFKLSRAKPVWWYMWQKIKDPVLIFLILAALLSTIVGASIREERERMDWIDGIAIWVAVIVVTLVGAWTDYSKDFQFRKLQALRDIIQVTVRRGGQLCMARSDDLVVGDVVSLDAGDRVMADGILLSCKDLRMDESALTGHVELARKVPYSRDHLDADVWVRSGTQVCEGSGLMLVLAVGSRSCWSRHIESSPIQQSHGRTALQKKTAHLANTITRVAMAIALIVFTILIIRWCVRYNGFPLEAINSNGPIQFMIYCMCLLVVGIPEGLPLAVTLALAYSVTMMMRDQSFVRELSACETMGQATTILTDKTGALTENKMSVEEGWVAGARLQYVPGPQDMRMEVQELLTQTIVLTSKAFLVEASDTVEMAGNRTECALLMLARNWGAHIGFIQSEFEGSIEKSMPFTPDRKMSSALIKTPDQFRFFTKGAPEMMLERSTHVLTPNGTPAPMTIDDRTQIALAIENMSKRGLRCIFLGYEDLPLATEPDLLTSAEDICTDLVCCAVLGLQDPIRADSPAAVKACREAGINVRMVTGESLLAATQVALACGIMVSGDESMTMEGTLFRSMVGMQELRDMLPRLKVIARASHQDKVALVKLLQDAGEVVVTTGASACDAEALEEADVGISLGLTGSEVAKQHSDIIALDDSLACITKSVLWGRSLFTSIRKFLMFQLTIKMVVLISCLVTAAVGSNPAFSVMQLLWVNLIQDTLAALALAADRPDPCLMKEKPYLREKQLLTRTMMAHIAVQAVYQLTWVLVFIYVLPVAWRRYQIIEQEPFYHSHCQPDLMRLMHYPAADARTYCDVMLHCGFPMGREERNGPACPLWREINADGLDTWMVPENLKQAMCAGETVTCRRYLEITRAITLMQNEYQARKATDFRHTRSVQFNAFVMMQIANAFCVRRLNNEYNLLSGIWRSPVFLSIIGGVVAFQAIILHTELNVVFKVLPLNWIEWLVTIAIGLGVIPLSMITRLISRYVQDHLSGQQPLIKEGWAPLA